MPDEWSYFNTRMKSYSIKHEILLIRHFCLEHDHAVLKTIVRSLRT